MKKSSILLGQTSKNIDVNLKLDSLATHAAVIGMTGSGKCLGPDVPVMMYDGSIKRAVDVQVGDILMGPDSQPRRVHSTVRDQGLMYKIIPVKGESWTCNDTHVLTLVHTTTGEIVDIPLNEYLNKPKYYFKHRHKLFFQAVDFPNRAAPDVDPYFMGVWFGDGSKSTRDVAHEEQVRSVQITKPDAEIADLCHETARYWGLSVTVDRSGACPTYALVGEKGRSNPLLDTLRNLVGIGVHIPDCIKYGNRAVRRAFLAGMLDTDGYLSHGVFDFVQKRQDYANDVVFIAKSLGIQATKRQKYVNGETYWRICLSGDFTQLPIRIKRKQAGARKQIKDVTRTGFKVECLGVGDYAGFTLDGDGRFLLGDFTVTHNSGLLIGVGEELIDAEIPTFWVDIKGDIVNLVQQQANIGLASKMEARCLTPGGDHGESVNIFSDLENPGRVSLAVSALLKMIGDDPDPLKSKSHAYLSHILERRHASGQSVTLVELIHAVQDPGFVNLGAMDVDFAFPKRSRTALATKINNLLIAPAFQPWREGVKLNFDKLVTPSVAGKVPVIIYSVAHLVNQDEQQFAVALLLNELLMWAKRQGGSGGKLKYAVVIDECVGLIPPHPRNPPTKAPLMQILKQARAFGLGAILATQNPVDLDYKAMSNAESWFVSRLQMEKDRARIISNICNSSTVEPRQAEIWVGRLKPRQFLLVRPKGAVAFTSRNVTANLSGPLTPEQIAQLYHSGELVCGDPEAQLRHQLHLARKEAHMRPTHTNLQRVAVLEQQLAQMQATTTTTQQGFSVIPGGKTNV